MENVKKCTKCGETKPLSFFPNDKRASDGKESQCKSCRLEAQRQRILANPEKHKEMVNKCRAKRKDKEREYCKQYYEDHKEERKAYRTQHYLDNKDKANQQSAAWYAANKEQVNQRRKELNKRRYHSNPTYKLRVCIRERLKAALRFEYKKGMAVEFLGCSVEEFRLFLESKFLPGMSWDNYGKYGWHIDHIIPLSSVDLTDPDQTKKVCHYTNLQPLWATDNLKKHAKLDWSMDGCQIKSCAQA